jgi:HD-GYP domain-containing protein (c-di-GMP phosphodiesterase class II)
MLISEGLIYGFLKNHFKGKLPGTDPEISEQKKIEPLEKKLSEFTLELENQKERHQMLDHNLKLNQKKLDSVTELSKALCSASDLEGILSMIIEKGLELVNAKTGSLMLIDTETNYMTIKSAKGIPEKIQKKVRVKIGDGISGFVAQTGEPLLIKDIENAGRFSKKSSNKYETSSLITVPLKIKDRIIGVFNINNKKTGDSFSDDDLELITLLAVYAAISIETAKLQENLSKSVVNVVKLATNALEAKDAYTAGHSERVTEFGTEIARYMGCSEDQIETIRQAGLLHDIGKIGISDAILLKPSRLTDEEFEIIKTHPAIGYAIVSPMNIDFEIREAVLHHHERYDGRGYPDGQKGEEISIEARILCVADSFDAMTSTRAYRKSLANNIVVKELIRCSNSQFDPDVASAFLEILKERQFYTEEDLVTIKEELKNTDERGRR